MNLYSDIFTNPSKIFMKKFKSLEKIKGSCVFMVDTNVLLLPYTVGSKELSEIVRIYKTLLGDNRLFLSAQVAKEFAKNRPKKLEEMYKSVSDYYSRLKNYEMPKYPMLGILSEYKSVSEIENRSNALLKEYKAKISEVMSYIKDLNWDDSVSVAYSQLFLDKYVVDNGWKYEEIKKELEERFKYNLPPAFKDKGKEDGGIGDFLIWKDLIHLGQSRNTDVVFVTGDEKSDWFHQSSGSKIYPRFELVYEFNENTSGRDIHLISLSEMMELFSKDSETIDAIRTVENERRSTIDTRTKAQALLRSDYLCKRCGVKGRSALNPDAPSLEIHRIVPISKGGTNSLNNIVVLCPNCHNIANRNQLEDVEFISGSPCQMSGQMCPGCKIGTMDVTDNQNGVKCNICELEIPSI